MPRYTAISDELIAKIKSNDENLTFIGLKFVKLTDEDTVRLVEGLRDNTRLKGIDLLATGINDTRAQLLAQLIIPGLSLDISQNPIGTKGLIALARNPYFSTLSIWENHLPISKEVISAFAENSTLVELEFMGTNQQIDNECAKLLAQNKSLRKLTITDTENGLINDQGAEAFLKNTSLIELSLDGNSVSEPLLEQIKQQLTLNKKWFEEHNKQLIITRNNRIRIFLDLARDKNIKGNSLFSHLPKELILYMTQFIDFPSRYQSTSSAYELACFIFANHHEFKERLMHKQSTKISQQLAYQGQYLSTFSFFSSNQIIKTKTVKEDNPANSYCCHI